MTTVLLVLESIDRKLGELLKLTPKPTKVITGTVWGPTLNELKKFARKAKPKRPRK